MAKKPKRPKDPNQLAKMIADMAVGDLPKEEITVSEGQRKGGLKGGKARANALTPEQRAEIARTAAEARWKKSED